MPRYRFTIALSIRGPLLTKDSHPAGYGVDAPFFQRDGALVILGTHVEGKLREAFAELAALPASGITKGRIAELMGAETYTGDLAPARGHLHFGDFKCGSPTGGLRYRVKIDRDTGAASERMLLLLESHFASGQTVTATGGFEVWAGDDKDAEQIKTDLMLGLRWVRQIGAARTVGFGALTGVEISFREQEAAESTAPGSEAFLLRITPEAPFFFGQHTPRENVLVSETTIPGAAIKGCLASALRQQGKTIPAWFDLITITHAFPAAHETAEHPATKRPVRAPLSLGFLAFKRGEKRPKVLHYYDLAATNTPAVIENHALSFRVDWKSQQYVIDRKSFGWADPARDLRVRTAIDSKQRRAKDESLYSLELINPEGCDWLARVDFSAVAKDDRADARKEFAALLGKYLHDFGKTKARAEVALAEWCDTSARRASSAARREDGTWIITLQTPTLLADPRLLARDRRVLHAAYADALHEMSGQTLVLRHFYASQSLAGGKYLWRRFQENKPYNPWLLTDAGSVFVLALAENADPKTAQDCINDWLARGLPQPAWAKALYSPGAEEKDHWKTNPFLRENGYGEIAVNLDTHTAWHPATRGAAFEKVTQPVPAVPASQAGVTVENAQPKSSRPPKPEEKPTAPAYDPRALPDRWIITATFITESPLHIGTGGSKIIRLFESRTPQLKDGRAERDTEKRGRGIVETEYNTVTRDHAEKPVIPGSAWKGPFRAAFARAFGNEAATTLFGPPEATTDGPIGGQVEFLDATFASATTVTGNLPLWDNNACTAIEAAVALNRRTRTAADGKLYYTEFVPAGTKFTARLTAQGIGEDDVRRLVWMLENVATRAQFGAEAGNGWGRVGGEAVKVHHFTAAVAFEKWRTADTAGHGTGKPAAAAGYDACKAAAAPQTLSALAPTDEKAGGELLAIPITLRFHSPLLVRRSEPPKEPGDTNTEANALPRLTSQGHALLSARSFRGALRSQCERILRTLLGDAAAPDPSAEELEALHDPVNPSAQLSFAAQIFGAAGWRATLDCTDFISVAPAAVTDQEFVAIDRFTGGSATGKKFKWQAAWPASAPATMDFQPVTLRLDLTRLEKCGAQEWAPGLLALALRDLAEGDITFGAGAGKGYGACTAEIAWLKTQEAAGHVADFRAFVQKHRAAGVDAATAPA